MMTLAKINGRYLPKFVSRRGFYIQGLKKILLLGLLFIGSNATFMHSKPISPSVPSSASNHAIFPAAVHPPLLWAQADEVPGTNFPIVVDIDPETDKIVSEIVARGSYQVYNGNYKAGLDIFSTIRRYAGEHPVSYLYQGVVYYLIVNDIKNYTYIASMNEYLDKTIRTGKKLLRRNKNKNSNWIRFYIAVAYGIRGLVEASYENFIRAFTEGIKSLRYMKEIIAIYPDFYDAFYAIGVYDYWYSVYLGFFMSRLKKERQQRESVEKVRLAFTSGTLARTFAGAALVDIYKHQKNSNDISGIIDYFMAEYPNFPNTHEFIGGVYLEERPLDWSIERLSGFRESIDNNPYKVALSYLRVDYWLALAYYRKGDIEKARTILTNLMTQPELAAQVDAEWTPVFMKKNYQRNQNFLAKLNE